MIRIGRLKPAFFYENGVRAEKYRPCQPSINLSVDNSVYSTHNNGVQLGQAKPKGETT